MNEIVSHVGHVRAAARRTVRDLVADGSVPMPADKVEADAMVDAAMRVYLAQDETFIKMIGEEVWNQIHADAAN